MTRATQDLRPPAPRRPFLAVALLALVAAGCGGASPGTVPASPGGAPATPTPVAAGECASLEDYSAEPGPSTGPAPTIGPMPSIGPEATLTSGVLQPGEVALVGDEAGPGALLRISDPRTCERFPNARPDMAGYRFVMAHVELVALRGDFLGPWIPTTDRLVVRRADPPQLAGYPSRLQDAPGMNLRSSLRTPAGFKVVTNMAWEVPGGPATDLLLEFRHAEETLQLGVPADVAWAIGPIPAFDGPDPWPRKDPPIDSVPASGRLTLADPATVVDGDGAFAVQVDRFDQVEAYPGIQPALGAFVEVRVGYALRDIDPTGIGTREWRAVDGRGTELAFLVPPESRRHAVPSPLLVVNPNIGWLIIDAPPEGEIRLEYRRAGEGPVLFEVLVRVG